MVHGMIAHGSAIIPNDVAYSLKDTRRIKQIVIYFLLDEVCIQDRPEISYMRSALAVLRM